MNTSVDISYYPLTESYLAPIKDFIRRLHLYQGIEVKSNGMSTQVFGDYDLVMGAITAEIKASFALPHSVFVLKVINAELNHDYVNR